MKTEKNANPISWLHGLQDYLEFKNDLNSKKYVDFLLSLLYSNSSPIKINENLDINEFVYHLRKYTNNPILDILYKYLRLDNDIPALQDAFSRGQVQSKIWLVDELQKLEITDLGNTLLLAGWFGQFISYLDNFKFDKARIIELDKQSCIISDRIFNIDRIEGHIVKSVLQDINDLTLTKNGYELDVKKYHADEDIGYKQQFLPNTIINTSSEHVSEDWFFQLKFKKLSTNPIVAIQSNNLFDIPEHINCVHSVEHMKKKYPFTDLLYEGEKELFGYKRFMLIGRP